MRKPSKAVRLTRRIRDEIGIEIGDTDTLQRLYTGHIQRSEGAWVWIIGRKHYSDIGSIFTVTELLKAPYITAYTSRNGDTEIFPAEEKPANVWTRY